MIRFLRKSVDRKTEFLAGLTTFACGVVLFAAGVFGALTTRRCPVVFGTPFLFRINRSYFGQRGLHVEATPSAGWHINKARLHAGFIVALTAQRVNVRVRFLDFFFRIALFAF